MLAYICVTIFGAFLLDGDGSVLAEAHMFPDTERAIHQLTEVMRGETPEILRHLSTELDQLGIDELVVETRPLKRMMTDLTKIPVNIDQSSEAIRWFRSQHDEYLLRTGKADSKRFLANFRHGVAIAIAKIVLSEASEEKDQLVKNAIDAIVEIDKSINMMAMRLREWWSLYHPSLNMIVDDHEVYSKIVRSFGEKSEITSEGLITLGVSEDLVGKITESIDSDEGAELSSEHRRVMQELSDTVLRQYDLRRTLEHYVSRLMTKIGPNTSALAGPLIAARLLSITGSLKELARKPSSTIQILGAEKALFRSLKTGADPPKHGVIFQVPLVNSAPYWQRGKIARALAGKLAIAAKIDAYSKRDYSNTLLADLRTRVKQIQQQNPEAPSPKPRGKKKPHRGRGRSRKRHPRRKRGG